MYVGRFLVVGPGIGGYRVSSRSFPNRKIVDRNDSLTVTPTAEAPETDNPYISYNCVRTTTKANQTHAVETATETDTLAVVGNGSHVDPITEKLGMGYPARDAIATVLLSLDYEKDDYDTPRIAGVVGPTIAHIGTVRRDALLVREVDVSTLVATYERADPEPWSLEATTADGVAAELYTADFDHTVCAAGVTVDSDGVEIAIRNEP